MACGWVGYFGFGQFWQFFLGKYTGFSVLPADCNSTDPGFWVGGWVGQLGWVGGLPGPEAAPEGPPPPVSKQRSGCGTSGPPPPPRPPLSAFLGGRHQPVGGPRHGSPEGGGVWERGSNDPPPPPRPQANCPCPAPSGLVVADAVVMMFAFCCDRTEPSSGIRGLRGMGRQREGSTWSLPTLRGVCAVPRRRTGRCAALCEKEAISVLWCPMAKGTAATTVCPSTGLL